eukprot:scaffold285_cov330-Pavlova_lutheri.AAC.112
MGKLSNYASVVLLSYFAMRKHCNVRCRLALLYMYMHLASVNESASSSFFSSIGLENSPLISSSTPLNNRKKGSNPIGPGLGFIHPIASSSIPFQPPGWSEFDLSTRGPPSPRLAWTDATHWIVSYGTVSGGLPPLTRDGSDVWDVDPFPIGWDRGGYGAISTLVHQDRP